MDDADALDDGTEPSALSDDMDAGENETAVAANEIPDVAAVRSRGDSAEGSSRSELSATQADSVYQVRSTIAALELTIEALTAVGSVKAVHSVEAEIQKQRRIIRELVSHASAVAETFLQLRRAEEQEFQEKKRHVAEMNQRKLDAAEAIAARNAAVAEMKRVKRSIQDIESTNACKHAIKTFSLDALGAGSSNAGGAKAKKSQFEVLDRLSRHKVGLSAAQRNDFQWWKDAWDEAMVTEHGADWADTFASWVQNLLDSPDSNAFSKFMHDETCRVLNDSKALAVPGG